MKGRIRNFWQACQRFCRRVMDWAMRRKSFPGRSIARKRPSAATTEAAQLERQLRIHEGLRRMQSTLGRKFRAVRRARRQRTGREG